MIPTNTFTDWIEEQAKRSADFVGNDILRGDFLGDQNIVQSMSQNPAMQFDPIEAITRAVRGGTSGKQGKVEPPTMGKLPDELVPPEARQFKDTKVVSQGSGDVRKKSEFDRSTTARGSRGEIASWIDNLDNKTYTSGGKSVTSATGVVLKHSGIKVDAKTSQMFREGAKDIINEYNQVADPNQKELHNYYELLTEYLMALQAANTGQAPEGSSEPLTAPDGSTVASWNPNQGQQFESAPPGMNSLAVRQNQIANAQGNSPTQTLEQQKLQSQARAWQRLQDEHLTGPWYKRFFTMNTPADELWTLLGR